MDEQQHDLRVTDSSPANSVDDSQGETATTVTVARMLANPRRVRRA
jgi:hypothetical protein